MFVIDNGMVLSLGVVVHSKNIFGPRCFANTLFGQGVLSCMSSAHLSPRQTSNYLTNASLMLTPSRSPRDRRVCPKERAKMVLAEARRRGISVRSISCSFSTANQHRLHGAPPGPANSRGNIFDSSHGDLVSEEEGVPSSPNVKTQQEMHAETRGRSSSVWLYFPHIELIFLFFAFEGALAADLAALRENESSWVLFVASMALVSDADGRPTSLCACSARGTRQIRRCRPTATKCCTISFHTQRTNGTAFSLDPNVVPVPT